MEQKFNPWHLPCASNRADGRAFFNLTQQRQVSRLLPFASHRPIGRRRPRAGDAAGAPPEPAVPPRRVHAPPSPSPCRSTSTPAGWPTHHSGRRSRLLEVTAGYTTAPVYQYQPAPAIFVPAIVSLRARLVCKKLTKSYCSTFWCYLTNNV